MNNPFLTKKDSLVEAVQSAMQDGELRRQAEALVNEEFGVYSRKAVVREQLAAYDARLEEAYKCMKEAPDTGESDARKTVTSSKEAKEKVFAKHKERVKKLADKDYDKDGKIESPKDEVWGSRFRAAKMAGKMEEEQIDEISKKTLMSYRSKRLNQIDKMSKDMKSSSKSKDVEPDKIRKSLVGIKTAHKKLAKEETQIEEVSKRAAISAYRGKEGEERDTSKLRGLIKRKWGEKTAKHADRAGARDTGNLVRRGESSGTDRLARATSSSEMRKTKSGKVHKQDVESKKSEMKFRKSMSKFDKPRGHLPEETMDEAAYSAKAARAGKDIGKPGKMFSKIAAKAGEKYGSEERGKKVAGAILKRIRAKHMKEDQDF